METNKKVSVLVTVFNGIPHLEATLNSLLSQDYGDFEIIVVDDGSTDGTPDLLKSLSQKHDQIKCFFPGKIGRGKALNFALSKATGSFIAINDADDLSFPTRFSKQVDFLEKHPDYVMVGSNFEVHQVKTGSKTVSNAPIEDAAIRDTLSRKQAFQHSTVIFRKETLIQAGGYSENIKFLFDRDVFIRILKLGKGKNLPERLVVINRHDGQFFMHNFTLFSRLWWQFRMCVKAVIELKLNYSKLIYPFFYMVIGMGGSCWKLLTAKKLKNVG